MLADIADLLADLIPDVRHLLGADGALQVDEDRRHAGARVAAQEVEVRRFLQLALEPLGDLLQRVFEGRAGPGRLHDHRLDDEARGLRCGPAGDTTRDAGETAMIIR